MKLSWIVLVGAVFSLSACSQIVQSTPVATATQIIAPSETESQLIPTTTAEVMPTSKSTVVVTSRQPEAPISLPDGFKIGVYTSGLAGPRMMALGPDGWVYVAERGANRVVRLKDENADGEADGIEVVARIEQTGQPGILC